MGAVDLAQIGNQGCLGVGTVVLHPAVRRKLTEGRLVSAGMEYPLDPARGSRTEAKRVS